MFPVLHRYLGRELLRYWLAFTLVLWLVLLTARFSLYLGQAASGRIPADTVLWLLGLKSVGFFVFLMPLTLFLALLWLLGRLNRDREMLALAASGVGPLQLYQALLLPAVAVALLVGAASALLVPQTAAEGYRLRAQAERRLDASALTPGRFHFLRGGRWLVYAQGEGDAPGSLRDVFIHIEGRSRAQVLVARRAAVRDESGVRYLVLSEGYHYSGNPGQADYRRLHFQDYRLRLSPEAVTVPARPDAVATPVLWRDPSPAARAELARRLARPVSVLLLVLVAVPLARYRPGASRYAPLWAGVLVFTLYFSLLGVGRLWIEQGRLPAGAGLWWVHALLLAVALALLWRQRRLRA